MREQTEVVEVTTAAASSEAAHQKTGSGRTRLALGLAAVALVAAVIGALGPAETVRSTYSWPPSTLPEATPSSVWYTPLLLMAHRPQAISATFPCAPQQGLATAGRPLTALATARRPERNGGLSVTQEAERAPRPDRSRRAYPYRPYGRSDPRHGVLLPPAPRRRPLVGRGRPEPRCPRRVHLDHARGHRAVLGHGPAAGGAFEHRGDDGSPYVPAHRATESRVGDRRSLHRRRPGAPLHPTRATIVDGRSSCSAVGGHACSPRRWSRRDRPPRMVGALTRVLGRRLGRGEAERILECPRISRTTTPHSERISRMATGSSGSSIGWRRARMCCSSSACPRCSV